jgi:hypothetical protein
MRTLTPSAGWGRCDLNASTGHWFEGEDTSSEFLASTSPITTITGRDCPHPGSSAQTIPPLVFVIFQFAIAWSVLVYAPIAHWVFSPTGWLAKGGSEDFAAGTVVHPRGILVPACS